MQVLIVIYTVFTLFVSQTWAYNEYPMGTVNAYAEPGTQPSMVVDDYPGTYDYCSNPSHAFAYSATFQYQAPDCLFVPAYQLIQKGVGRVDITSHVLEYDHVGFPCDSPDIDSLNANCTASGGSPSSLPPSNQCECVRTRSIYPIGLEQMVVAFGHSYKLPDQAKEGLRDWTGSSSMVEGQAQSDELLPTEIKLTSVGDNSDWNVDDVILPQAVAQVAEKEKKGNAKDSQIKFPAGATIEMYVGDWLKAAGTSLEDRNIYANYANGTVRTDPARNRLTGIIVNVRIKYTNGEPSLGRNRQVTAEVTPEHERTGWAGAGPLTITIEHPKGTPGGQTYHYVTRYRQGIQFNFEATGKIYYFEITFFVNTILLSLVLLANVNVVTDFVAFYCMPGGHSTTLRAHRFEQVSKASRFAELGMKTALAAISYRDFDSHNNQVIQPEDFVRVLGRVNTELRAAEGQGTPGRRSSVSGGEVFITFEKAYALALAVLDDADITGSRSLDFFEYMNSMTGGTIDFKTYISRLQLPKNVDQQEMKRMRQVWDTAQSEMAGADALERKQRMKSKRREFRQHLKDNPDLAKEMLRPEERMKKMQAYGSMGDIAAGVTSLKYGSRRNWLDVVAHVKAYPVATDEDVAQQQPQSSV